MQQRKALTHILKVLTWLFFFKWMEGKRESRLELKCLPIELIDGGGGFCGDDR